ncbi:MAG: hypothetical protein NT121_21370 [Chloroflexi bacterium]|nr:hypothetical protein [Chloroflexota bacterium]
MESASTPKERMLKALRGEKPGVLPAAPVYLSLFLADAMRVHYIEQYRRRLQGRSRHPVDHAEDTNFRAQALIQSYGVFKNPPDWLEIERGASKAWAERTEIVSQGDRLFYSDKVSGVRVPMDAIPVPCGDTALSATDSRYEDAWDAAPKISSRADVDDQLPMTSADEWLARGDLDLPRLLAAEHGDRYFIQTVLDSPYSDVYGLLGFKGLIVIQRKNPDLFLYMLQRQLEQSRELVTAWAQTGIHGVFVEEVFTGADSISPGSYDKFVLAFNQPYFLHMSSSGLLPIHYVCGDAVPRLQQMVACDIAAVVVEEGKKRFRNEIADVLEKVAGRAAVFGNIDAVQFGIRSTPEAVSGEVKRQATIGAAARGFIVSTGSPFPLETNPQIIDTLVSTAHSL